MRLILLVAFLVSSVLSLSATIEKEKFEFIDATVQHYTAATFEATKHGVYFIFFGATWCQHCRSLTPIWKELEDSVGGDEIHIGKVECSTEAALCDLHEVKAYPALKVFFDGVYITSYPDASLNTLAALQEFIKAQALTYNLKVKDEEIYLNGLKSKKITHGDGVVRHLNTNEYNSLNGDWIIMYHAPWCGHCKTLAPIFEQVAVLLKGKVNVGKVDCTANPSVCEGANVKGYPTLIYTSSGMNQEYTGPRTGEDIKDFALDQSSRDSFTVIGEKEYIKLKKEQEVFFVYAYTERNQYLLNLVIASGKKLKSQIKLYICPYIECIYGASLQSLTVIKDNGLYIQPHKQLTDTSTESATYLEQWFSHNAYPFIPALTPSTSTLLLSGDRVIVLGITRASVPELTRLKRGSGYGDGVEYVWVDVAYKDYLKRVYGLESKEAIIVIRPKVDLFWTEKGKLGVEQWISEIVKGNVKGKSSLGFVMRSWKGIVWGVESVWEYFADNMFYFWIGCFIGGCIVVHKMLRSKMVVEKAD